MNADEQNRIDSVRDYAAQLRTDAELYLEFGAIGTTALLRDIAGALERIIGDHPRRESEAVANRTHAIGQISNQWHGGEYPSENCPLGDRLLTEADVDDESDSP